jgi:hypothetical protein
MSDIDPDAPPPGLPPADHKGGINVPDEVEALRAEVDALKAWRADIEARIDTLGGNA